VAGDDGFRFGHILIRDAAYDAIPKRLRASLHEAYADWLASRLGDETPNEIAGYHLEQAYRYGAELGAPDRDLGARAAARLTAAARAAEVRRDIKAALNLYGRAVELVPGGSERPGLLVSLGSALNRAGELERAEETLEQALASARELADPHIEWLARLALVELRWDVNPEGGTDLAIREGEAAIAEREPAQDHAVLARAWWLIAQSHDAAGRFAAEQAAFDRAMAHATQSGDFALETRFATSTAPQFIFGPAPVEEGLRYVDDLNDRLGHIPAVREFGLHVVAHLRARLGESEMALEAIAGFREPLRERGEDLHYALTSMCVWDVCHWAGAWESGEGPLREAHEMSIRMGNVGIEGTTALNLADVLLRQGRVDEATDLIQAGEERSASDDVFNQVKILSLKAALGKARGDLVAAEDLARQAVGRAASAAEFLDMVAGTWLDLAAVLQARGSAEAGEAATEALNRYQRKGNLVGIERARVYLEAAPDAVSGHLD
jgi:tetratricopeptide (TPR) repeat protein